MNCSWCDWCFGTDSKHVGDGEGEGVGTLESHLLEHGVEQTSDGRDYGTAKHGKAAVTRRTSERKKNGRGLELWQERYEPLARPSQAAILFLHDVHEHGGRYEKTLEEIAEKNQMTVFSLDMQSHGHSEAVRGFRGACNSFDEFVEDACSTVQDIKTEFAQLPVYLWGHGFGGLVAVFAVLKGAAIDGMILSAPSLGVEGGFTFRIQSRAIFMAGDLTPDLPAMAPVNTKDLSEDPQVVEAYESDPLCNKEPLRCRLSAEILKAYARLEKEQGQFQVANLLVLFGEKDRISDINKAKLFFKSVTAKGNKDFREFPDMGHCLFHEEDRDQVLHAVSDWLATTTITAPATGTSPSAITA